MSAILSMVLASLCFAIMGTLAKLISQQLPVMEVVFFRAAVPLLLLIPLLRVRRVAWRGRRWGMLFLRGAFGLLTVVSYFYAISRLPFAVAVTLNYTSPVFTALLAAPLLGERLSAVALGMAGLALVGVLLLLRPDLRIEPAALVALLSAVAAALANITVRSLGAREPNETIVTAFSVVCAVGAGMPAVASFVLPSVSVGGLILLMGLAATAGQFLMTRAYRLEQANIISVYSYSTVAMAYLLGVVFFGEVPDPVAMVGGILIVVAGVVLALHRRARVSTADVGSAVVEHRAKG